ncbi:MAG: bifunctional metallophosphatase/5'-nucleotidase [Bacteroidales bacterium]|nr:bifunctional metallophosphatase/5'-nucleotidase [Bacteroidales bacterium]
MFLLGGCGRPSNGPHTLEIYITSDVHGCYLSRDYQEDRTKAYSMSKVATALDEARMKSNNVILIDNGDNLQGDNAAFFFNFVDTTSQHLFARIANYLDYDAVVVGNHDIEAGHDVYDRVRKQFNAPVLAANAIRTEEPKKGSCYFKEYTIVRRDCLRVAIIGFTNPNVTSWITEPLYHGMEFVKISDMAQELVDKVRTKERADIVIVSVHAGSGEEDEDSIENCGLYLAKHLTGVDMVIGGHDHKPRMISYSGGDTPTTYIDPGARCKHLGHVTIKADYKKGKRVGIQMDAELLPMEEFGYSDAFDAEFADDYRRVKAFTLQEICQVSESFNLADALTGPSAYMNLLYDLQLDVTGADLTFAAPLSSYGIINKGTLVYNDLTRIYPFENKLFTIRLTGEQIKNYLEYSYDRWINRSGPAYCYDSCGGLRYKVYKNRPMGSRVVIESMEDGTPFEAGKSYTVAITSYRAMGGDGLLSEGAGLDVSNPEAYIVDKCGDIRGLLYDYLTATGTLEPTVNDNWKFIE